MDRVQMLMVPVMILLTMNPTSTVAEANTCECPGTDPIFEFSTAIRQDPDEVNGFIQQRLKWVYHSASGFLSYTGLPVTNWETDTYKVHPSGLCFWASLTNAVIPYETDPHVLRADVVFTGGYKEGKAFLDLCSCTEHNNPDLDFCGTHLPDHFQHHMDKHVECIMNKNCSKK